VSTKKTAFKTSISLSPQAKAVCDAYIKKHGLRENITSLSDLVGRALMAYCLPPVEGGVAGLTSGGREKIVRAANLMPDTSKTDAALADSVRARVKALQPIVDRIRNPNTQQK
tara:strand:- start:414 stop:752 length:339 start_codon:yes stop_codon:yes gene_type:complete